MKIKRTAEDDLFSKLVRERANHTCEHCGKYCGPKHEYGRLDCSHFFSRRHNATRWEPLNAAAHCFTCHQRLGESPPVFTDWIKRHLGHLYDILEEKHNQIVKVTKKDRLELRKHLKQEYERMLEARAEGETGRIEFAGYF